MSTLTLLLLLAKFSAVDVKQIGHNLKLAGKCVGKAAHKIVLVVKRAKH